MAKHADQSGLEITIRWGETPVLVRHLSPPRTFILGTEAGPDVDFVVPEGTLATARWTLVHVTNGVAELAIPHDGDEERVHLAPGQELTLRVGDLEVHV